MRNSGDAHGVHLPFSGEYLPHRSRYRGGAFHIASGIFSIFNFFGFGSIHKGQIGT
jgi:hypothetical protein